MNSRGGKRGLSCYRYYLPQCYNIYLAKRGMKTEKGSLYSSLLKIHVSMQKYGHFLRRVKLLKDNFAMNVSHILFGKAAVTFDVNCSLFRCVYILKEIIVPRHQQKVFHCTVGFFCKSFLRENWFSITKTHLWKKFSYIFHFCNLDSPSPLIKISNFPRKNVKIPAQIL